MTRDRQPCGTHAAYKRHVAAGETPCQPCIDANRAHNAEYKERPGRKEVERRNWRARSAAHLTFRDAYREEWEPLYEEALTVRAGRNETGRRKRAAAQMDAIKILMQKHPTMWTIHLVVAQIAAEREDGVFE